MGRAKEFFVNYWSMWEAHPGSSFVCYCIGVVLAGFVLKSTLYVIGINILIGALLALTSVFTKYWKLKKVKNNNGI